MTLHAALPRPLATFTVLFAMSLAAQAQTSSGPRYGTKEDLRQCMDSEDRLKAEKPSLHQTAERHQSALKQVQQEMRAQVESQKTLDTLDDKAVAEFNGQVDVLNSRVEALNREAEAHQAKADDFNARMLAHNKRCAGMVYRIPDIRAVEKERAAAAKAK